MDQLVERSVAGRRFDLRLVAAFGALGLLLAVLGIYGVTAGRAAAGAYPAMQSSAEPGQLHFMHGSLYGLDQLDIPLEKVVDQLA